MRSGTERLPGPGLLAPASLVGYRLLGERGFEWMFCRYGALVCCWAPGVGRIVLVKDPVLGEQIIMAEDHAVGATESKGVFEVFSGPQSLVLLDGVEHRQLRKLVVRALRQALERNGDAVTKIAQRTMDGCPSGTPFELLPRLQAAMLEALLRIVLGVDEQRRLGEWSALMLALHRQGFSDELAVRFALRRAGGLRLWRSFHRFMDGCDRLVYAEIACRRNDGGDRKDVLGLLMETQEEFTDQELRDQVMTLLGTGYQSAAAGVAWAVERLVRHPEVLRRLGEETLRPEGDAYLTAVVYELLRLRPPVAFVARTVRRPYDLGGHSLRPGTTVLVHLGALHRHPGLYPDPSVFRPERFLEVRPDGRTWLPFGGGPHKCPGSHLAIAEIKAFLRAIVRTATLAPADPADEPVICKELHNYPGRGCAVIVRRR